MVLYECKMCNYKTSINSNYHKHINTKKHRNNLASFEIQPKGMVWKNTNEHKKNTNEHKKNTNEHTVNTKEHYSILNTDKLTKKPVICEFCGNSFNTKASMRRHMKKYCKVNPNQIEKMIIAKDYKIESLEKDKQKLEEEKSQLYTQVATLLDKVGDTTNIQNNIILNNYGNEDLSHITDALKTNMLNLPFCAIPKMIEAIHFNDEKPENKNIVIPNKKENLVKVFQGDKWIYKNKSETITDLVDSKYTIIDEHYDGLYENNLVNPNIKTTFSKFRQFYEEGDVELVEKLKRECELILLNNR